MSDNTFDLYYDGYFYKLTRDTNESFDTFYQRCWYVSKKKPSTQDEFNKYNSLSVIWRNYNIYNMKYDDEIIKKL